MALRHAHGVVGAQDDGPQEDEQRGAAERDALRAQLKVSQWQPSTVKAVSETCNPERVIREAADAEYQLQFYTDQAERYASGPLNQPLLVAF